MTFPRPAVRTVTTTVGTIIPRRQTVMRGITAPRVVAHSGPVRVVAVSIDGRPGGTTALHDAGHLAAADATNLVMTLDAPDRPGPLRLDRRFERGVVVRPGMGQTVSLLLEHLDR